MNKNSLENCLSFKELAYLITFETGIYTLPEEVVKISNFCYKSKNQDSKFYVFIIDEIPVIIKDKKKLLQKSNFRQLLKIK